MSASVVNVKYHSFDIRIGRSAKHPDENFGNPFSHIADSFADVIVSTREESVELFEPWLYGKIYTDVRQRRRDWIWEHLHLLKNRRLGCYCKLKDLSKINQPVCHGDIYVKILESV